MGVQFARTVAGHWAVGHRIQQLQQRDCLTACRFVSGQLNLSPRTYKSRILALRQRGARGRTSHIHRGDLLPFRDMSLFLSQVVGRS